MDVVGWIIEPDAWSERRPRRVSYSMETVYRVSFLARRGGRNVVRLVKNLAARTARVPATASGSTRHLLPVFSVFSRTGKQSSGSASDTAAHIRTSGSHQNWS